MNSNISHTHHYYYALPTNQRRNFGGMARYR